MFVSAVVFPNLFLLLSFLVPFFLGVGISGFFLSLFQFPEKVANFVTGKVYVKLL
jgi:hypothetical protein